jgi:hypothetical protein
LSFAAREGRHPMMWSRADEFWREADAFLEGFEGRG